MESVRLRVVFPLRRRILSKTQNLEELNRSWFLLNPTIHHTIADVASHLTSIFKLNHSCPHGIYLSMDGFVLPPFESTCILKDKDLIRVKRKKREISGKIAEIDGVNLIEGEDVLLLGNGELDDETNSYHKELEERKVNVTKDLLLVDQSAGENAGSKKRTSKKLGNAKAKRKAKTSIEAPELADGKMAGKKKITEKQHKNIGVLRVENEQFEMQTIVCQSELQEKEAVSKKRKASKELESPNHRKKKKRAMIYQDIETDVQVEKNMPCHSPKSDRKNKKSSVAQRDIESIYDVEQNCDVLNVDNIEKVSRLESEHDKENTDASAEENDDFVETLSIRKGVSAVHGNGTEAAGVPHTSEGNKKVSRSARRAYEKRKFRKELKAEVKELLAEKVLIPHKHSPETDIAKNQNYQNGFVVGPGHIRFEPYEKDQDVQQSQVVEDTFQLNGTTSKRKNWKLDKKKIEYCTRSKCKDSGGEFMQVATIGKAKPQDDLTEFNRLPLLTSCPKEGDVIAYRVLEQSTDTGPILSSFRIGKTLRLDNWTKTLLLTSVEENPATPVTSDKGAWEHQDNSIDKESECIEIDVASLYDVRIVKHAPGSEVDVWDSLSQASSVKNSLLIRKREWGKVRPASTSSKQRWGQVGPTTTSSKNEWGKAGPTTNSFKNEWGKAGPTTNSSKNEWGKAGPNTTSYKKEWRKASPSTTLSNNELGKVVPTATSSSTEWANVDSTTTSSKQDWDKVGPTTTSPNNGWGKVGPSSTFSKQEWRKVGPNKTLYKKGWGKVGPTTTTWNKEWSNAGASTSSWSSKFFNDTKQS